MAKEFDDQAEPNLNKIDSRVIMFLVPYICSLREILRPSARKDFAKYLREIENQEQAIQVMTFIQDCFKAQAQLKLKKTKKGASFIIQTSDLARVFRKPQRAFRPRFRFLQ